MTGGERTVTPGRIEIVGPNEFVLKQYIPEDAEAIFDVMHASTHSIEEHEPGMLEKYQKPQDVRDSIFPPGADPETATEHQNPARLRFEMCDNGTIVGGINITPDKGRPTERAKIGYWTGGEYESRGYATKATGLLVDYAFDQMGLSLLSATANTDNEPSQKVLERTGFRLKDVFKPGRGKKDMFIYELSKEERIRMRWQ